MHCLLGKGFLGLQNGLPSAGVLCSLFKPRLRMPSWQNNFSLDFCIENKCQTARVTVPCRFQIYNFYGKFRNSFVRFDKTVCIGYSCGLFDELNNLKPAKKNLYFFLFLNKNCPDYFTFDL
jgi:hypothetical protein